MVIVEKIQIGATAAGVSDFKSPKSADQFDVVATDSKDGRDVEKPDTSKPSTKKKRYQIPPMDE